MNTAKQEGVSKNTFNSVLVIGLSGITYIMSSFVSMVAFAKWDFLQILFFGVVSAYCVEVIFFKLFEEKNNQSANEYLKKQWDSFYNRCPIEKIPSLMRRPTTLILFLLYIFIKVATAQLFPFALYLVCTGLLYLVK